MKENRMKKILCTVIIWLFANENFAMANKEVEGTIFLNEAGQKIEAHYTRQMEALEEDLKKSVPTSSEAKEFDFLASDGMDSKLVKFVILKKATPRALAEFGQRGKRFFELIEALFSDPSLMRQMLVADGARAQRMGRKGYGPPQYGKAMEIYSKIQDSCKDATAGIFQRLALAISLEHAVPVVQTNPAEEVDAPETVDPVKRYHHYK